MDTSTPTPRLLDLYRSVRSRTEALCAPLAVEDHVAQPITDVSPPKWHLGHTSWFFENFILIPHLAGYRMFHPRFGYLFNSYYESVGDHWARPDRGHLSRPTVEEVLKYRAHVDAAMADLLAKLIVPDLASLIELGLHHEQQHQELLVTDLKVILGLNPLAPAYEAEDACIIDLSAEHVAAHAQLDKWLDTPSGPVEIGHSGAGFAFDNELPRHTVFLAAAQLRQALVTNAEYLVFMSDGGYTRSEYWHAEGWDWVRSQLRRAPMYWQQGEQGQWMHYTLSGLRPLESAAPVTHVNFYEAFAFCQWAGWRLPTEFEWETAASRLAWGDRWEWTQSAYLPYPGFRRSAGAVGEYNGKFMVNQQVLRGASFATPPGHGRQTYRNFFHPPARWQYTGIRPSRDVASGQSS